MTMYQVKFISIDGSWITQDFQVESNAFFAGAEFALEEEGNDYEVEEVEEA